MDIPTIFWLWIAAAVIFLIIEITTPALFFACFVVASVGAGAVSYFSPDSILLQAGVFAVSSMILIPLTRPLARKMTQNASNQKINVDAMVGETGIVIKKIISSDNVGQVRVSGQVWRAVSEEMIEEGARIRVENVTGAKLHVIKIEEDK